MEVALETGRSAGHIGAGHIADVAVPLSAGVDQNEVAFPGEAVGRGGAVQDGALGANAHDGIVACLPGSVAEIAGFQLDLDAAFAHAGDEERLHGRIAGGRGCGATAHEGEFGRFLDAAGVLVACAHCRGESWVGGCPLDRSAQIGCVPPAAGGEPGCESDEGLPRLLGAAFPDLLRLGDLRDKGDPPLDRAVLGIVGDHSAHGRVEAAEIIIFLMRDVGKHGIADFRLGLGVAGPDQQDFLGQTEGLGYSRSAGDIVNAHGCLL